MAAKSQKKELEALNDLLTEVITVRRAAKEEYEWKLKKYYVKRANQMQHGVFDGVELPEINLKTGALQENLQMNKVLVQKAQFNHEQYYYAAETSRHSNEKLKQVAESLQKVMEIERLMNEQ